MQRHPWPIDGHPQRYHIAALLFAVASLGFVATSTILAEDTTLTGTNTTSVTTVSCSYTYSSWGICQSEGKRYRSVSSVSPSGCNPSPEPALSESCTYSCSFTYSEWTACQPEGKRYRSVMGTTPSGCTPTSSANTNESCTYTSSTINTTNTTQTPSSSTGTTATISCSYSYSDWGVCQDGRRSRSVTSISPSGCVQTTAPLTGESCTASSTTTTTNTTTASSTSESRAATQCSYTYGDWSLCQLNGKRTRALLSKYPTGCEEYTQPVLEQICIFDGTTTTALSNGTSTITSSHTGVSTATASSTTNTASETNTTLAVTPPFSFLNVSDGAVITGAYGIRGQVQNADSVEYYLVPVGSNTFKYIGSATQVAVGTWSLGFHSTESPNGAFYLRAKIKNRYGEYGSGQRTITIANQSASAITTTTSNDGFTSLALNSDEQSQILNTVASDLNIPEGTRAANTNNPTEQRKDILEYCEKNTSTCTSDRDSDHDGLSDVDEIRYGTNPYQADTDLDGFTDGSEVRAGFDPLKYSPGDQSDRMVFESPKTAGEVKKDLYTVSSVSVGQTESSKPTVHLSGKGLPNSFVTIYIYSDPIVLTVKTDSEGNWTYDLDKELEDGQHEAYVAVTDNTGKITAKSEPIAFVKTAQAVTVIPSAQAVTAQPTRSVTDARTHRDLLYLSAIIVAALAIALSTIGLMKHRRTVLEQGSAVR